MKQIKHFFTLLCLLLAVMPALAQEIKIDSPVMFGNNEAVNMPVYFSSDKDIAGMQFDILLPDFLEFDGDVIKNQDRFNNHGLTFNKTTGRVLIFNMQNLPIKGEDGILLEVPVKVKSSTATGTLGTIRVNNIIFSTPNGTEEIHQDAFDVRAEFNDVEVTFSVEPTSILINPGEKKTLSFNYTANCDVYSMEATFVLPEGLSIKENPVLGSVCSNTAYGQTFPNPQFGNAYKIACIDFTNTPLSANEGTYFTFTVEADESYNGQSGEIMVEKMVATYTTDGKYVRPADFTIAVESSINAYNSLMEQIGVARSTVEEMLGVIAEECPDVKDNFTGEAINEKIDALESAVKEAHANGTLNSQLDSFNEQIEAIGADIEKMLQDAYEAERQFKAEAANKAAFDRMNETIGTARSTITDMLAAIAEECPDVKDDFKGEELTTKVDALKEQLDKWNEEGACAANENDFNEQISALAEAIEAYQATALAAEEQFKADKAAAENKAAFDRMNETVEAARTTVNDMLAAIAEECPDVKDDFKGEEISAKVDALKEQLDKWNEEGTCVANEDDFNEKVAALAEEIEAYQAAAAAAEEKFKSEQREAANKAAYERLTERLDFARNSVADMLADIAEECPDVKDDFKGEAFTAEVEALASEIESLNEQGLCADNEQELNKRFDALEEAIEAYLAEAVAAEEKYKVDAANRAAYDKVIAEIDALQSELDAMVAHVAETYPEASVTQFVYIAQSAIDKARQEAHDALEAVADGGEFDYTVDADTIRKLIAEIELMAKQLGVTEIGVEDLDADAVIYTLTGRRVVNPTTGVYIIVTPNGKAKKVAVK